MQLDIQFPIHIRAKPVRARLVHDVVAAYRHRGEVAEISASETAPVLEAFDAYESPNAKSNDTIARRYRLFDHGGRVYRKVATSDEVKEFGGRAFSDTWHQARGGYRDSISFHSHQQSANAVAAIVQRQVEWDIAAKGRLLDGQLFHWPPRPQERRNEEALAYLNRTPFADVLRMVGPFDGADMDKALATYGHQFDKLLAVDGELYMETPPPCYIVQSQWRTGRTTCVMVHIGHLQEDFGTQLDRVCFPLERREEALAYAGRLAEIASADPNDRRAVEIVDRSVAFSAEKHAAFDLDHKVVEVRNLLHRFACSNVRSIDNTDEGHVAGWMTPKLAAVRETSADAIGAADFARGTFADIAPFAEDILTTWKKCRRPSYNFWITGKRREMADLLTDRVREHLRDAPISVLGGLMP
jgi:hypothetical protein